MRSSLSNLNEGGVALARSAPSAPVLSCTSSTDAPQLQQRLCCVLSAHTLQQMHGTCACSHAFSLHGLRPFECVYLYVRECKCCSKMVVSICRREVHFLTALGTSLTTMQRPEGCRRSWMRYRKKRHHRSQKCLALQQWLPLPR